MALNLIITGVGGQGNVLASQVVGKAAVKRGLRVTIGETFGLSQRGGPVMSHIRLSRKRDYGPLIPPNKAHIIIGLEPLETIRVLPEYGNSETTFVVNSWPIYPLNVIAAEVEYPDTELIRSLLEDAGGKLYWLEATRLAIDLGAPILLNMIMLGTLCALPDFPLQMHDFMDVLGDMFPESRLELNYKALEIGKGFITENEN